MLISKALCTTCSQYATCTSPIMHLICQPKILHNLSFSFLLRLSITAIPREIENNTYAKFLGRNKGHYGRCASGEWEEKIKFWRTGYWLQFFDNLKSPKNFQIINTRNNSKFSVPTFEGHFHSICHVSFKWVINKQALSSPQATDPCTAYFFDPHFYLLWIHPSFLLRWLHACCWS